MKHSTKMNLIFVLCLLAVAALLFAFQSTKPSGSVAVLTYGMDHQTMTIPLNKDARYDVDTGIYTVHLEVKDEHIRFVDSPCPDHLCESFGWIGTSGESATCLPALASMIIREEAP